MVVLQPCGTIAAEARHRRNGEEPCEACKTARKAYDAHPGQAARRTAANNARNRALTRLCHLYPKVFAGLLAEERAKEHAKEARS